VTFINTDGMSFIGPGSEWFWTALSGIVLAVTFLAIYRQLRMQRSQSAREQLASFKRDYDSERMTRHKLACARAIRDGVDPAHLPAGSGYAIATFWEGVADLAKIGHIDEATLYNPYATSCELWWGILAPLVARERVEFEDPGFYDAFEWLAGRMDTMNQAAGQKRFAERPQTAAAVLVGNIPIYEEVLRVEEALRAVVIASPEAATPASVPSPATAEG
jgi:hypothetical protein